MVYLVRQFTQKMFIFLSDQHCLLQMRKQDRDKVLYDNKQQNKDSLSILDAISGYQNHVI